MPSAGLYLRFAEERLVEETVGRRFAGGIALYDGEATASFGDGLFAVPIRALWETISRT